MIRVYVDIIVLDSTKNLKIPKISEFGSMFDIFLIWKLIILRANIIL